MNQTVKFIVRRTRQNCKRRYFLRFVDGKLKLKVEP